MGYTPRTLVPQIKQPIVGERNFHVGYISRDVRGRNSELFIMCFSGPRRRKVNEDPKQRVADLNSYENFDFGVDRRCILSSDLRVQFGWNIQFGFQTFILMGVRGDL
jgi:hypothetical protein